MCREAHTFVYFCSHGIIVLISAFLNEIQISRAFPNDSNAKIIDKP